MSSPKHLARIAGLFYLGLLVFMGPPALVVRDGVRVPGDAAATAANIAENATLFRLAFVSDLVGITLYLALGMALYLLLRHVNGTVAAVMVLFVALGTAIYSVNLLNHLAALTAATDGGADALFFLDLHAQGYNVAQVYFGLWLLPLGYLALRSGYFPRPLGILLMVAAGTHLVEVLTHFLFPGVGEVAILLVQAPAVVAEFWMLGYLLIKSVRLPDARVATPVAA
jgi:hypothetical protein